MIKFNLTHPKTWGFTLIELLVVVTIIIVLTTIGLISYSNASKSARDSKRKADLETVRQALVLYRSDVGSYPVGAGGDETANYSTLVETLGIAGYLTNPYPSDPGSVNFYGYTSGGTTFQLKATLENGETPNELWIISNP